MTDRPTWEACAAAGMTAPQAAAARGTHRSTAYQAAARLSLTFRPVDRRGCEYRRAGIPCWSVLTGMTAAEAAAARGVSVEAAYNAAARHRLQFRAAPPVRIERIRPSVARLLLSERERDDYRLLRKAGYGLTEALGRIGRPDLVEGPAKAV